MRKATVGFTLIELLVVIGIISLLIAIIMPVFSRVKRSAKSSVSISNIRQCGLALLMYCNDNGGYEAMPTAEAAAEILKKAPTCDPSDTWRQNCSEDFGSPLIGSYGYVRSIKDFSTQEKWNDWLRVKANPTLLASIFYANNVPLPFKGDSATYSPMCGIHAENCSMPDHILRMRLDGSASVTSYAASRSNSIFLCSWQLIMTDDGN